MILRRLALINQFDNCWEVRPVLRIKSAFSLELGYGWSKLASNHWKSIFVDCFGKFERFFLGMEVCDVVVAEVGVDVVVVVGGVVAAVTVSSEVVVIEFERENVSNEE